MKNLKKYITLNLFSISGYIFLVLVLVLFYIFPGMIELFCNSNENAVYELAGAKLISFGIFYVFAIVEFIIISAFILEFLIYKLRKTQPQIINIPEKYNRAHTILLAIGILLSTLPIIGGMYFLLQPV